MRLFVDTNIFMDVLGKRPGYEASGEVLKSCEDGRNAGCISALTVANLNHLGGRLMSAEQIKSVLQAIMQVFEIEDLTGTDLSRALDSPIHDYEDALQFLAAKRARADRIVTRNTKDFKNSPIQTITPEILLQ